MSIKTPREPATQEDLRWWLTLAATLQWTWAVTYAESAPHWYVVLGRTPGPVRDDYLRAGRVIRTFGEPGKSYSMTNLYLFTEDRSRKFWCMWGSEPTDEDATLINMATTERTYGEQRDVDRQRIQSLASVPLIPRCAKRGARWVVPSVKVCEDRRRRRAGAKMPVWRERAHGGGARPWPRPETPRRGSGSPGQRAS